MAHEFNNLLSIISGRIEKIKNEVEKGSSKKITLHEIEKMKQTVDRIAQIIKGL
ncbi:MAG: hypothetical protein KA715_11210 [Xanthomonadaceae bacterium]|nr:hypothetical protein [Xanthomonadaceae bacterium]